MKSFLYASVILMIIGCTSSGNNPNLLSNPTGYDFTNTFDYQPQAPENGQLMGIMELGSSGFNSFIVNIDEQDRWSLEKASFDKSMVTEGAVTLEHVLSTIQSFKDQMIAFGVDESKINLVASSSALKEESVQTIAEQLRDFNIGVINVSADQEGRYALKATVPNELIKNSFLVDIGSGNTKICWVENNETKTLETYGSKYYLNGVRHLDARKELKRLVEMVPNEHKALCFIIGGAAHRLASVKDNNAQQRYTILDGPDKYVFDEEEDLAALNLYRAVWNDKTISYVFDWETNFSIGVLMELN